jgi:hypothetical protein
MFKYLFHLKSIKYNINFMIGSLIRVTTLQISDGNENRRCILYIFDLNCLFFALLQNNTRGNVYYELTNSNLCTVESM